MNENHATLCPSPEWTDHIQSEVLPFLAAHATIGPDVLEIGPGPGAATEWLSMRARRLVALEIDPEAQRALAERLTGRDIEVRLGDASDLDFADDSFDTVVSCTMLHHVATLAAQNRVLAEVLRVLRPGGVLVGSDSVASNALHHFHEGDTYNPVDPAGLLVRLQTLGYGAITICLDDTLMFIARKPAFHVEPLCSAEDEGPLTANTKETPT